MRVSIFAVLLFLPLFVIGQYSPAEADENAELRKLVETLTERVEKLEKGFAGLDKRMDDRDAETSARKTNRNEHFDRLEGKLRAERGSPANPEKDKCTSAEEASNPPEQRISTTISAADAEAARADFKLIPSQARAVPYFRNGVTIGSRFFAIRKGGIFDRMGLVNGDIVLLLNGKPNCDATAVFGQATSFNIGKDGEMVLLLERSHRIIELKVKIVNGK